MANLKICRICVRTESKTYSFDRQYLKSAYEDVLGYKVDEKGDLPKSFCYECAAMLHKFHKFKEKCYFGQLTLQRMSWKGPITYEAVKKLNRNHEYLRPLLGIMSCSKRIQTYVIKCKGVKTRSPEPKLKEEIEFVAEPIEEPNDTSVLKTSDVSEFHADNLDEPELDMDSDIVLKSLINNESDTEIFAETMPPKDMPAEELYENDEINLQCLDMNEKDEEIVEIKKEKNILKQKKPKFQRISNLPVDLTYWKKTILSDEEAKKTFEAKSQDSYYVSAAYKCKLCYKGFSKEDMLKRHNLLRHNEKIGEFICQLCKMRFRLPCELKKHMKAHFHKYECLRCDLVCSLENTALLHNEYHNGVKRKCEHCGEEFRHSSTYYTHMRTHRSSHVCTLCGSSFVSDLGLRNHKKIKHIADVENYDDEELNTYCKRCDIRFETRKAYEEHLFHSVLHCEVSETDLLDDGLVPKKIRARRIKREISDEMKLCNEDDLPLISFKRPKKGRRICKKPTTCHQCGKHFATQAECMKHHLTAHPRTSFHPPSERHICEICGASLAPGSVAMHENIHTRKKLHPCETCGKVFHSGIGLKRHMVTHTGEKPFACTLCDKRFTQSNSMKLHFKTFHLKQPYPKRNRRKKKDEITEVPETNREESPSHSSGQSPEQIRRDSSLMLNRLHEDNMQYLTLT